MLIEFFDEAPDVGDVDGAGDDEKAVGAAVGNDADFGGGGVGIGGVSGTGGGGEGGGGSGIDGCGWGVSVLRSRVLRSARSCAAVILLGVDFVDHFGDAFRIGAL